MADTTIDYGVIYCASQSTARTRCRTDNFAADVTYLQIPIQVCFSSTSQFRVLFQTKKEHFPVTLNFALQI